MVRGALHDEETFEQGEGQKVFLRRSFRQKRTGSAEPPRQEQGGLAHRPEGASSLRSLESASQTQRVFQLLFISKVNFLMEEKPLPHCEDDGCRHSSSQTLTLSEAQTEQDLFLLGSHMDPRPLHLELLLLLLNYHCCKNTVMLTTIPLGVQKVRVERGN